MKRTRLKVSLLLLLALLLLCACTGETVPQPTGSYVSEDGTLTIDFDTLRGTWVRESGERLSIDVLYSYTLGNIAFYANETEVFLGSYELTEDVLIIRDGEGAELYRLSKVTVSDQ